MLIPSSEAASRSTAQEFPNILWKQKEDYRVYSGLLNGPYLEPDQSSSYPILSL
jgi:hypothetical protein